MPARQNRKITGCLLMILFIDVYDMCGLHVAHRFDCKYPLNQVTMKTKVGESPV